MSNAADSSAPPAAASAATAAGDDVVVVDGVSGDKQMKRQTEKIQMLYDNGSANGGRVKKEQQQVEAERVSPPEQSPLEVFSDEAALSRSVLLLGGGGGGVDDDGEGGALSDETDALPNRMQYTWRDALVVLLSIVSFLVDTGTDIWVAVYFYRRQQIWEFALTLAFVVVPALTMTCFSLRWYINDADVLSTSDGVHQVKKPRIPMWKWAVRIVCLVFQLGPLLRYCETMLYGLKSMRAQRHNNRDEHVKNYIYMIYKDADATLLRLFESFMEAAPQLVLQLYILASEHNRGAHTQSAFSVTLQVIAVSTSLFSLAWSLCSYQRSLRYSLPGKQNLSTSAMVTLFFWHLCSIAARVLAIALCASVYPVYVACGCVAHWLLMTCWLVWQQTEACYTRCEELVFDMVLGAVYIFTFFNVKDQPTRYKYALFYTVCGVENCAMVALWFAKADPRLWWYYPGLVSQGVLFTLALLLMLLYYRRFHPSLAAGAGAGGTTAAPTAAAGGGRGSVLCRPAQTCRNPHLARHFGLVLDEWAPVPVADSAGASGNGSQAATTTTAATAATAATATTTAATTCV